MSQNLNKKLYVGSLPYSVTEEELRDLFNPYGKIESVRIIKDKMTDQSKGFGFVEMATAEEAQRAVEGLNNRELNGRTLVVNNARPEQARESRPGGGGGRSSFSNNRSSEGGGRRFGGSDRGGRSDRY
jgi:RNA recognition motif-containing protein